MSYKVKYWDLRTGKPMMIGQTIKKIYATPNGHLICFEFDNKQELFWEATGDCCTQAWFQDITGIFNIIDTPILDVCCKPTNLKSSEQIASTDDEVWEYNSYEIMTAKGIAHFEFRATHNGYYGGDLRIILDPNETEKEEDEPFIEITTDTWNSK